MRRREFIAAISGAAALWPVAVRAQQPAKPVIGVVRSTTAAGFTQMESTALRQGLKEAGFVEGQNVAVELYYGDNRAAPAQGMANITSPLLGRADVVIE